jgi:starvation-inducible outer membrane lipoprotein
MSRMIAIVPLLTAALMLAACAEPTQQVRQAPAPGGVPPELEQQIDASVTFEDLQADPAKYVGRTVRLGGMVIRVKRMKDQTELELLELPMESTGTPTTERIRSKGRFLAVRDAPLDPATAREGTPMTIVGVVKGSAIRLDEIEYRYPIVDIKHLIDWSATLRGGPGEANWVAVQRDYISPGIQTLYVDPDRISRDGNLVTVRQLIDYKMMQGTGAVINPYRFGGIYRYQLVPHGFFSTITQKQFDCAKKRVRLLAFTEFSHHMGTGRRNNGLVDQDQWLPVEPDTVHHAVWEMACRAGTKAGDQQP